MAVGSSDRIKPEVEEGSQLVYFYGYLYGVNYENLEGAVYGTEHGIIKVADGEVLGIIHVASYRSKLWGSSLRKSLGKEIGAEGGLSDVISDGNIVGKSEGY